MEIKIYKKEQEKNCFQIDNGEEREFNYDNFDYLIDETYNNDKVIKFINDEEFEDYKKLLDGIISESRKEDYRKAVNAAIESKTALENEESALDSDKE